MDPTMDFGQPSRPFPEGLRASIIQFMKYKERSAKTLQDVHAPGLVAFAMNTKHSDPPVFDVIFIGDSMIERLKTTGINTRLHNLPKSFNLGVGGDKIENVLYRLNTGYISLLQDRPPKLWVVHIGSNNLKPKRPLSDSSPGDYSYFKILLQTLLTLCPSSKVLVTGLFRRKDVRDEFVRTSNQGLRAVVDDLNLSDGASKSPERLFWMEPTGTIDTSVLADHVHLNEEGYKLWDESIYPRILDLIEEPSDKPPTAD